jgi:hypothetical protein
MFLPAIRRVARFPVIDLSQNLAPDVNGVRIAARASEGGKAPGRGPGSAAAAVWLPPAHVLFRLETSKFGFTVFVLALSR